MERISFYVNDDEVADLFKIRAQARGLTQGEYLALLVRLHDAARVKADAGDAGVKDLLEGLKLQTVLG